MIADRRHVPSPFCAASLADVMLQCGESRVNFAKRGGIALTILNPFHTLRWSPS
jgi:hypothetical protein